MRPLLIGSFLLSACFFAFFFGMSLAPAPSSMAGSLDQLEETHDPKVSRRPVLVELFTSQGCSSCPPADQLLEVWAADTHRDIIALSFHVDYWNRLGWRDPFSSAEWSQRQRLYNEAMRTGRIYTPQLVIDGAAHCVGSDVVVAQRLLDEASRQQEGVSLGLRVELEGRVLKISVVAEVIGAENDEGAPSSVKDLEPMEVWVALAESGLETSVKTGENARRTLRNDFVVRQLDAAFPLDKDSMSGKAQISIDLPESFDMENISVVAFAQETATRRIRGAGVWPEA